MRNWCDKFGIRTMISLHDCYICNYNADFVSRILMINLGNFPGKYFPNFYALIANEIMKYETSDKGCWIVLWLSITAWVILESQL